MSRPGQLRVVHVSEDMSVIAGGVTKVVTQLSKYLSLNDIPVQVVYVTGDQFEFSDVKFSCYPPISLGRKWFLGHGLREGVARLAVASNGDALVFHLHGVWMAPQLFAARAAHQVGVPYVLSSHGMLEPWLWDQQGWLKSAKKRVYWSTLAYPAFCKASVIHAITHLEQKHLAQLFPNNRIEVIPNAIEVSDVEDYPQDERSKTILFLGRIDPKKGIDILLRAFARAKIGKDWSLDVVGPVWSEAYSSKLKEIIDEDGIGERVRFLGPKFGEEKRKLLDTAWVLATPSHSEAIGLVNLEAADRCLPVITTHQTGLHDWELGGGLLVEPNVDALIPALEAACSWNAREQHDRGMASRRLVLQRYSLQAVMPMWLQLYSSL